MSESHLRALTDLPGVVELGHGRHESAGAGDDSPFQRVLMQSDGTVTHLLEAYLAEPIAVAKLLHETIALAEDMPELDLTAGDPVVRRSVLLVARITGRPIVQAHTTIALNRVDPAIERDLRDTDQPIGLVLRRHRLELFREPREEWRERNPLLAPVFGVSVQEAILGRTYCMIAAGRPLMLITERFSPMLA